MSLLSADRWLCPKYTTLAMCSTSLMPDPSGHTLFRYALPSHEEGYWETELQILNLFQGCHCLLRRRANSDPIRYPSLSRCTMRTRSRQRRTVCLRLLTLENRIVPGPRKYQTTTIPA